MHYFASLERFAIDRGNTIVIPTRPDLNDQQTTQDRVWNTIVRGDHQLSPNHTYNVRWLREQSPQMNQIIPTVVGSASLVPTGRAAREESDVDQTLAFSLNSVLSNTKVNTLRVTWTRENVTFANACFNANDRDLLACPPTLPYQNFIDQQDNTGQSASTTASPSTTRWPGSCPASAAITTSRPACSTSTRAPRTINQGNLNGTFAFGQNDADFNPAVPKTYPDRLTIRVGGPSQFYQKATYVSLFVQDKWRMTPRLTLSLGLRYDLEIIPLAETDNPLVESYPVDKNNIQPRLGVTYDLGGGKSVVRAGYGRFYDKTHFELMGGIYTGTPFTNSFLVNFPTSAADPGPRNRPRCPTDPYLVNGPVVEPHAARPAVPARTAAAQHRRQLGQRRSPHAVHRRHHDRLRAAAGGVAGGERRLRARGQPRPDDAQGPQPRPARHDGGDVAAGPAAHARADRGLRRAARDLSGLRQLHDRRDAAAERRRTSTTTRCWSASTSASAATTSCGCRTRCRRRAATRPATASPTSGFQVLDDLHLELNEGPSNFDSRHNFVVSGRAVIPKTGGLNVSWVARALSGTPFTLVNNHGRPGPQREPHRPAARRQLLGHRR